MEHKIIKCKKTQNYKRIIKKAFLIEYFYIVIIYLSFPTLISQNEEQKYNIITLKINKTEERNIFYRDYPNMPAIVEINGINQSKISSRYYFNTTPNTVRLIWKKHLTSLNSLFQNCYDIIELNLSHFDTSSIDDMDGMF